MLPPLLSSLGVLRPGFQAFRPSDLPGLQLWLCAEDLSALSDGDAVATWTDRSGQGNDAIQSTPADRPTFQTGVLNGRPAVRFDNGTQSLVTGLGVAAPYTMIVVEKPHTLDTAARRTLNSDSAPRLVSVSRSAAATCSCYVGAIISTYQAATLDGHIAVLIGSAAAKYFVDGADHTTGVGSAGDWPDLVVGSCPFAAEGADTDVLELLVYDSALDDTERQRIERYLADQYAISI